MMSALQVSERTTIRRIGLTSILIVDRGLTLDLFSHDVPAVGACLGALIGLVDRLRRGYDHVLAGLPVDRTSHSVLVYGLQRPQAPQDLIDISSEWDRIVHGETDDPLGVDEEDAANGEADLGVDQIIEVSYNLLRIGDYREIHLDLGALFHVAEPLDVRVDAVHTQTDYFAVQVLELLMSLGELDELRRTDRCKVGGVGEEQDPLAAELRQGNGAL